MKKNWKLPCMVVIMIAVTGLFWACGDGDNGMTGPDLVSDIPAPAPQFTTSDNPTPTPPANPTYTDGPELIPKRGNNPFGSGYACEDYPVGVAPVWINKKESKWTIWTIKNTTDQRWRVSGKVYGEKEPGCAATQRGRKDADDILIIEDPGWIEVGETRDVHWRIDMSAMYNEDYLCGRFQFGIGLKPETHGRFLNHTDRVIDTGSDECEPPSDGCKDKALDFHLETQQRGECGTVFRVKPVKDVSKPNPPTFSAVPAPDSMDGAWYVYNMRPEGFVVTFTAKNKCMTKTEIVKVPPRGQCCDSSANVTVTPVPGEECDKQQCFDVTYSGSPTTTLNVSPEADDVSGNRYCFDRGNDAYKVTFTASNECTSDSKPVRVTKKDPCCDSFLKHESTTDECSACVTTSSSTAGNGKVMDASGAVVHTWSFPAGEHNECSNEIEEGGYTYEVKNRCENDGGKFSVECEVCEACKDFTFNVDIDGDTLIITSSLPFTVDGKGYQPGRNIEISFEIGCEERKTVEVKVYDTKCGNRELCGTREYTLRGDCQSCENVSLETRECSTQPTGLNAYEVKCGVKATGGTSRTWEANPGIGSGNLPDGVGHFVTFSARCENSGDVIYRIMDGDEPCESETEPWDTPECQDSCENLSHRFGHHELHCGRQQFDQFKAQTNMAGRYCLTGGGLNQSLAQSTIDVGPLALRVGDCTTKGANEPVDLNVPADGGEYTVTFTSREGECEWEEEFDSGVCENGCDLIPPEGGEVCLSRPLGNPRAECNYFLPGSVVLGKDEFPTGFATRDALLAITKTGSSACPNPSEQGYFLFPDVEVGDDVSAPAQSHTTYCGCPSGRPR